MNIKRNILMLSLLVLCIGNYLNASDACSVVDITYNGKSHKVECKSFQNDPRAALKKLGCPMNEILKVEWNGQCVPLEMICKVITARCNRISVSTKKS